ncbi:MAG: nuclease [Planctomycetes bacterium]|nr:nuclease [Planctomycetota bacterium]
MDRPSPNAVSPAFPARLRIIVDDREPRPGVADAIGARWDDVVVGRLDVGDVAIGARVLVERKTVADFVVSIEDGRLFRQMYAISHACHAPLLIVEGEDALDAVRIAPRALRGTMLTILTGYRVPMLRTESVEETAEILVHLAEQEERRAARAAQPTEPRPARVALGVLAAVPGVGDHRARRLLQSLGSVKQVVAADDDTLLEVPDIGPATVRAIRRAFEGDDAVPERAAPPTDVRERPLRWIVGSRAVG